MKLLEVFGTITEGTLSTKELAKGKNWEKFYKQVKNRRPFRVAKKTGDPITIDPQEDLLQAIKNKNFASTIYQTGPNVILPTTDGGTIPLSKLYKTPIYSVVGSSKSVGERQEGSLVDLINQAIEDNEGNPITLMSSDENLKNVTGADRVLGSNEIGKEKYADISIEVNGTQHLVSAKGDTSPSIAGGGLAGIMSVNKNIIGDILDAAHEFYKTNYSHADGKSTGVPELYIKVPSQYKLAILKGTPEMGGPISYMYIGPMDVNSEYNDGILKVNGKLSTVDEVAENIEDLYFRIRKRRKFQNLDLTQTDDQGYPSIFFLKGVGHRRIVVVKKSAIPKKAKPINDNMFAADQ